MYQGKNTENIDIHTLLHNLTNTHKSVSNDMIKSGIENYPHGYRHLFMKNRYASPQLLALVERNYNLGSVVTFRANRKVFDS